MLFNQIKKVSTTYFTHRFVWVEAALFGGLVLPFLMIMAGTQGDSSKDAVPFMLMALGMPLFFLIPFLVAHVKTQFANSRARLLPNFYQSHLIVLGAALIALLGLYPLMLAKATGLELLGLTALALAVAAPGIWGTHLLRFSPILVSIFAFYSLLTEWGLRWWIVDAAEHRAAHAAIVAIGVLLIVAWLWRLCRLTEEMHDYEGFHQVLLARRDGSEVVEQRRLMASYMGRSRLTSWIGDWWHDRLGGYFGGSKPGLVRLLSYGFAATPVEVQAIFMAAAFAAIGLFVGRLSFVAQSSLGTLGAVWFLVFFALLLPGYMAGETMAQRRPRVAAEILLPLRRDQLIDGLFAVAIRNSVVHWSILNAALGIVLVASTTEISVRGAALFLLFSGATLFASIGLGLRTSVWPSMSKRLTVMWISSIMFIGPAVSWWMLRKDIGDAPFLLIPAVLVAVGILLFRSARRAWMNLEFG